MRRDGLRRASGGGTTGWLVGTLLAALGGCGGIADQPDAAVVADARSIDAAPPADTAPPPDAEVVTSPSSQFQTAGGGRATSASYRLEIRLGAPQPMGAAASANYHARLGPTTE